MQNPQFHWGDSIEEAVRPLLLRALTGVCETVSSYISSNNRTRKEIYEFIARQDEDTQRHIYNEFQQLIANPTPQLCTKSWLLKRRLEDEESEVRNVRARLENISENLRNHGTDNGSSLEKQVKRLLQSEFMQVTPPSTMNSIVKEFIDRTGNDALKTSVCACCALETDAHDVLEVDMDDIPNSTLLIPLHHHPQHDLFQKLLLEPKGLDISKTKANLCRDCCLELERNHLPAFALANNMWIGRIPECLQTLTLVERILIAKYFPTAYVVKLYPKQAGGAGWDSSKLYSGFKGCVSTYSLDPKLVQSMVDGKLLPAPPLILSVTVAVTFITPSGKCEFLFPKTLYARRGKVREALEWLRVNNPLYKDIIISEERLQSIPENGIPIEIQAVARHSMDIDSVIREHEGYIPSDAMDDDVAEGLAGVSEQPRIDLNTEAPTIIPLSSNGVVDVEGLQIPQRELMAHAFINSIRTNDPKSAEFDITERYAYRRGGRYINEYPRSRADGSQYEGDPDNPNHLLGSFPTLFPYGAGGFETNRKVVVSYERHIRWALRYHDKRFRLHEQFPFQVFGVFQKREVCRSVSLQIKKTAFTRQAELIQTLRAEDFRQASREEVDGIPFSNPGIKALRHHLKAVRSKISGTDENRLSMRSIVWSTIVVNNAPNFWITVNPSDQDPIAQVVAGAEIDLDHFIATAGPDADERARNIASDPFASAKFFHFIIATLLDVVFGIKKTRLGIVRRPGAFGTIQCYIGTVEAQGRGTLHLHMLLWLKDAPSASVMQAALKNEEFRTRVSSFIDATIRADIDGKDTNGILQLSKRPVVSYCRPIDPVQHEQNSIEEEKVLARSVQFHKCNQATCLRMVNGRLECKRRAPFATAPSVWISSDGEWGPKRMCPNMNSWNPWVMRCVRANHDVKLIINGAETCVLVLYTTNYTFKKQNKSSNTSALLADRLAYNDSIRAEEEDMQTYNKRLLQRCANALFTQREFSSPEVISYLMDWGDRFQSNKYVPIYLDGAILALKRTFPILARRAGNRNNDLDPLNETAEEELSSIAITDHNIELKDQLRDYQNRGEQLAAMSLFSFLVDTHEVPSQDNNMQFDNSRPTKGGRPRKDRIPYLPGSEKPKRCRMERAAGHEYLPRFIGKWFPHDNDPDGNNELHDASILLFFKPWRTLQDLKTKEESFRSSFAKFLEKSTEKQRTMIENIQYYHDCWDVAQKRRDTLRAGKTFTLFNYERDCIESPDDDVATVEHESDSDPMLRDNPEIAISNVTEDSIRLARLEQRNRCDRAFAIQAMQLANAANVFGNDYEMNNDPPFVGFSRRATTDDLTVFDAWETILKEMTRKQIEDEGQTNVSRIHLYSDRRNVEPSLQLENENESSNWQTTTIENKAYPSQNISNDRPKMDMLNAEQRTAHDIIERHIFYNDTNDRQLLMLVIGQGGTGKSVLIGAITETFAIHGQMSALAKTATSGAAAIPIGGTTIHSWAGLGVQRLKTLSGSKSIIARRQRNILKKKCLIIDEMSMLHDTLFADIAKVVAHTKKTGNKGDEHLPFAGMNIILMGDFHQFPPVGRPYSALYSRRETNDTHALQGRALYKQFNTVVRLEQQNRIRDQVWIAILSRLREGKCTDDDIKTIRSLILNSPDCPKTDFSSLPWSEAVLVTTRHTVREAWNAAKLKQHCRKTGNQRYIVSSEDVINNNGGVLTNLMRLEVAKLNESKTRKLSDRIKIAIGMKAMIVLNLSTEADVANGTRGTIMDIILDPREGTLEQDSEGAITLSFPPALILFKPDNGSEISSVFTDERVSHAIKVPKGHIPLTPYNVNFTVLMPDGSKVSISRRQYAMTGGYAFTDIKSQGQTIEVLVADLRNTPTGKISLFSAYVTLSRSRGRESIRILSDFDDDLFRTHPNADLEAEMQRLELLATQTRFSLTGHPDNT